MEVVTDSQVCDDSRTWADFYCSAQSRFHRVGDKTLPELDRTISISKCIC